MMYSYNRYWRTYKRLFNQKL